MKKIVVKHVDITTIFENPVNPRIIRDEKFQKLVQSIKSFPEMLEIRPIVVNADNVVLGGNMRLRACIEAGLKTVPIINADHLTEEQQKEFIIKDNVGFGEWDWGKLKEWDDTNLGDWGLDILDFDSPKGIAEDLGTVTEQENRYTNKIELPIYEARDEKPSASCLVDTTKKDSLSRRILEADISNEDRDFLIEAATRHSVFNYQRVADYYAHSSKKVQELMEESALVIIDFDKAIELGFVDLTKGLGDAYLKSNKPKEEDGE